MLAQSLSMSVRQPLKLLALLALAALLSLSGCATHAIKERQIEVTLDDAVVGKSVSLVFYGANATEIDIWKHKSIDDFFRPDDALRKGAIKASLTFEAGGTAKTAIFPANDPIWQKWKDRGSWDLVVFLHVPDTDRWNGDPADDPRRQVLPLDQLRWQNADSPIRLRVHVGSLTTETPPLPIVHP